MATLNVEAAARRMCELNGIDPDETVPGTVVPGRNDDNPPPSTLQWQAFAPQIIALSRALAAIQENTTQE